MTSLHPPRFLVEAYFAREPVAADVQRHVAECESCGELVERLSEERRAYLREHPSAPKVPERRAWTWFAGVPVFAAAVAACLVLVVRGQPTQVRLKGAPLQLLLRRGGVDRRVDAQTVLRAGDTLRFQYRPAETGYLMVLERDGTDAVRVVFPYEQTSAAAVQPGGEGLLPGAFALDEAAGPERFLAVFRKAPFDEAALAGAAWHAWSPAPPSCEGCQLDYLEVPKQ